MEKKPLMSELTLKNEKTGEVETYEIEDAEARRQLGDKASNEELTRVFGLADENINRLFNIADNLSNKKAEKTDVNNLIKEILKVSNKVDEINASDTTKGVSVSGTTLVIKV